MGYIYTPFTSRVEYCEVKILTGELHLSDEKTSSEDEADMVLPLINPTSNDGWGRVKKHDFFSEVVYPMPKRLKLRYISMTEGAFYEVDSLIDDKRAEELWEKQQKADPEEPFKDIVVGIAPYGIVTIWLQGKTRSVLLQTFQAKEGHFNEMEQAIYDWTLEPSIYKAISHQEIDDDMRQYCYRYVAFEEWWDEETFTWVEYDKENLYYDDIDIDSIEDHCTDGTYNYLEGDFNQLNYHKVGKPDRITVRWQENKKNYLAHFWFSKTMITQLFNNTFESDPNVKFDFAIRLDAKNEMYQLALRREGEHDATTIPWFCYQLIVFREDEEVFRSSNYNLKPGQWSWWL